MHMIMWAFSGGRPAEPQKCLDALERGGLSDLIGLRNVDISLALTKISNVTNTWGYHAVKDAQCYALSLLNCEKLEKHWLPNAV